jgi:hypothetical protein
MLTKSQKEALHKQYTDELRNYIIANKPQNWLDEWAFPPNRASIKNYVLALLKSNREGKIYEAIKVFYEFNGTITELDKQIKQVKESNSQVTIEFFFGGTTSKIQLLQFLAVIFSYDSNFADFIANYEQKIAEIPIAITEQGETENITTEIVTKSISIENVETAEIPSIIPEIPSNKSKINLEKEVKPNFEFHPISTNLNKQNNSQNTKKPNKNWQPYLAVA